MMIHRLVAPCILGLGLLAPAVAGQGTLAVGRPFPDLTLPALEGGKAVSIRDFRGQKAHWNNEANDLVVWVDAGQAVAVDRPYLTVANPDQKVSQETRRVEFEVRLPDGAVGKTLQVRAYALYYVCEDVDGTCLYRRQDIPVAIPLQ